MGNTLSAWAGYVFAGGLFTGMGNVLCKGLFGRKSKTCSDDDDEDGEINTEARSSGARRSIRQHSSPTAILRRLDAKSLAADSSSKVSGSASTDATLLHVHQQISPQPSSTSGVSSYSGDDIDSIVEKRRQRRRSSLPSPSTAGSGHPVLAPRMSAIMRRSSVGADSMLLRDQINARLESYSNTIVALTILIQHMTAAAKNNIAVARGEAQELQEHCAEREEAIEGLQKLLHEKEAKPSPVLRDEAIQTEIIETLRESLPPLDPNATREQLLDDNESLRHVLRMHREEIRSLRAERVEFLHKREQLQLLERIAEQRLAKIEELQASLEVKDGTVKDLRRKAQLLEEEVRQLEALTERAHIDKDLLQWRLMHDTAANSGDIATPRIAKKRRASSVTDLSSCLEAAEHSSAFMTSRLERELSNSYADSLADEGDRSESSLSLSPGNKTVSDFRRRHGGLAYGILDPQPLTPGGLKKRHLVEVSGKRSLSTSGKMRRTVHKSESCVSSSTSSRYSKAKPVVSNSSSSSVVATKRGERHAPSYVARMKDTPYASRERELFSR